MVSAPTLTVPEGSTATYTVVLTSQPTATVTVTPVSVLGFQRRDLQPIVIELHNRGLEYGEDGDCEARPRMTMPRPTRRRSRHAVSGGDYASETASDVAVTVGATTRPSRRLSR